MISTDDKNSLNDKEKSTKIRYMSFKISEKHRSKFKILLGLLDPMNSNDLFMKLIDKEYSLHFPEQNNE